MDWTTELIDQLDWHWQNHVRPRLDGMTDEEYLWEPVPGCWSLRTRGSEVTAMAAGAGDVVADIDFPEPVPAPVTTIAWRMAHLSVGVLGMRASNHFGDGSLSYETAEWTLSATEGLAQLDAGYDAWMAGLRELAPEQLDVPCGPAEGPWAATPFAGLILHISRETIHHAAEILLLRDLWRARTGEDL